MYVVPRITAEVIIDVTKQWERQASTLAALFRVDNGSSFNNEEFSEHCTMQGTELVFGVPYHPQGQGIVERTMAHIGDYVIAHLGGKHTTWAQQDIVDEAAAALNATYCTSIGMSPHRALFGVQPRSRLSNLFGRPGRLRAPVGTSEGSCVHGCVPFIRQGLGCCCCRLRAYLSLAR